MTKTQSAGAADSGRRVPIIGVSMPIEAAASWRIWTRPAQLLTVGYAQHVRRAGGASVSLPVGGSRAEAHAVVERLDGLIISGGPDVDPRGYGQEAHPLAGPFDPVRDQWEGALVTAALEARVPILGICRGMQVVNVVLGGTLIQHLPDVVGTDEHSPVIGVFERHLITTAEGSRLRAAIGAESNVPTYHHQAVDAVAPGLTAVAWSADGTVEALEDNSGGIVAVQWHPEEADEDNGVFDQFVRTCAVPAAPTDAAVAALVDSNV